MKRAISLFAGAGGMDVGFERAGFKVVWANEWDRHAAETYRINHPATDFHVGDIYDYLKDLPEAGRIDCVFGGPPCQGFSVAGKMDASDERSRLVFAFLEVVARTRPRVFVLENVKALGTLTKFAAVREELLRRAEKMGYGVKFFVLNSKEFGVPQSRERLFMIGFRSELKISFHAGYFDKYRAIAPILREVFRDIGPAGTESNPATCKARITLAEKPVMRKSPYAGMLFNGLGRPINPEGVSCTLPASMGGNKTPIVDERYMYDGGSSWVEEYHGHLIGGGKPWGMNDCPEYLRRLTIRESRAIQTFPEDYVFAGPKGSIYAQIGNAVPCNLAFAVAGAVMDALRREVAAPHVGELQAALC